MIIWWKVYANIATKIPAAVATKASEIAGAIVAKLTFDWFANLAKDSKIPITVPNRPTNGEVVETIDNHERPELASLINEISQALNISFDGVELAHLLSLESGDRDVPLSIKVSKEFFSLFTKVETVINLYMNIQKTRKR